MPVTTKLRRYVGPSTYFGPVVTGPIPQRTVLSELNILQYPSTRYWRNMYTEPCPLLCVVAYDVSEKGEEIHNIQEFIR